MARRIQTIRLEAAIPTIWSWRLYKFSTYHIVWQLCTFPLDEPHLLCRSKSVLGYAMPQMCQYMVSVSRYKYSYTCVLLSCHYLDAYLCV